MQDHPVEWGTLGLVTKLKPRSLVRDPSWGIKLFAKLSSPIILYMVNAR